MGFELRRSTALVSLLTAGLASSCSLEDAGPSDAQAGAGGVTGGSGGSTAGSGGSSAGSGGTPSVVGGGTGTSGSTTTSGGAGSTAGGSVGGSAGNATGGSSVAGSSLGGAGGSASGGGGSGGGSGGASGTACPADATFCSGFEDSAQPTGSVYKFNAAPGEWTRDFEVDTTLFHGGKSSLRVKAGNGETGSGAYQMLAVPAPTGAFWVRLYIQQTELDIGGNDHNVFGGAAGSDEPNASPMIELAEDVGLAFNTSDAVRWPTNFGRINGNPMPFTLAKGKWHCIELNYDGAKREQKLFVDGMQQINATDYPMSAATLKVFKFGFNKLHGPARKVWFDDVAVGPTRAGCL